MHNRYIGVINKIWYLFALILTLCLIFSSFFSGYALVFDYFSLIPQWVYLLALILLLSFKILLFKSNSKIFILVSCFLFLYTLLFLVDAVWLNQYNNPFKPNSLRVMSWNTLSWNVDEEPEIYLLMENINADIYLFQEVPQKQARGVTDRLRINFPGFTATHSGNLLTVSRFPIIESENVTSQGFLKTELKVGQEYIAAYNVHFMRPFYMNDFRRFSDYSIRNSQFLKLKESLSKEESMKIIAGDFNTTRNHHYINFLENNYYLVNPRTIFTIPRTYPTKFPLIRIDYQFVSKEFNIYDYQEFSYPNLSDHKAIQTTLQY